MVLVYYKAYSNLEVTDVCWFAANQSIVNLPNMHVLYFILQYGADVKRLDQEGRSALWYAKQVGSKDCAMILQSNGCPEAATLPRLRRGSLRSALPIDIKHKDRTSINSMH